MRTLANKGACHLQNAYLACYVLQFQRISTLPRYKIGKKGHTDCTRETALHDFLRVFKSDSGFAKNRPVSARNTLTVDNQLRKKRAMPRRGFHG
jgi:hypothetical protein